MRWAGGRPPRADSMKCYMMGPHRVGTARPAYWPHGPSLDGVRVLAVASGRNHMACIGVAGGKPAAFYHSAFGQATARPGGAGQTETAADRVSQ